MPPEAGNDAEEDGQPGQDLTGQQGSDADVVADWRQRPPRRRPGRSIIATGQLVAARGGVGKHLADDVVWDDRAEQDATQLVGLLFVAATPLRRTAVAETLRISQGRLSRACAVLQADPPRGLRLQEAGDTLGLVSGPECAATVERHLGEPAPEPLSQAALDTLAIIAYEQPITRADIRNIRSVDSDTVVETLRARGLVSEDARFWRTWPARLSHYHAGFLAVLRLEFAEQFAAAGPVGESVKTVAHAPHPTPTLTAAWRRQRDEATSRLHSERTSSMM